MSEHQYLNENAQQKARKPDQNVPDATPEVHDLVRLQGVVGNQGVQRLLAQRKLVIQPKLNVTAAGDKYEHEADSVAQQVVQQINAPQIAQRDEGGEMEDEELSMKRDLIQRDEGGEMEDEELSMKRDIVQRDEGGEMEDEELSMKRDIVQRVSFEDGGEVGGDIESGIDSARGSGQGLDEGIRGKMEGAFGTDFSGVRVHTDAQSDSLNKSIQAKAFTTGSDIFFSKGAYNPGSQSGQELLGHELTHVVQQGAAVQKKQEE